MVAYVIRQGDHLARLAAEMGFDAEAVWNHERNRDLRELRGDPQVLAPGDVLFVPETTQRMLELTAKTTNRYEADIPMVRVNKVLTYGGERPLADEPYEVHGLPGEPIERRTDEEGRARFSVPANTRQVRLFLPEQDVSAVIQLGHLDPPSEDSGVRDRLAHLGYFMPRGMLPPALARAAASAEERAAELENAVRAFQRDHDLQETGEADDATRDALREQHGS